MKRKKRIFSKHIYPTSIVLLIFLILFSLFELLDKRIRPVVTTMAQYQCKVVSVLAINEAVMKVLVDVPDIYNELVESSYSNDGTISSVHIKSNEVNVFKAKLTDAVTNELLSVKKQKIAIPLGTLLGWQIFSGRGPDISLTVIPASYVTSEITDTLVSAGINQTQHSIYIKFKVQMSAILAGYSSEIIIENEFCVAQTLIVGKVPQLYASK